ncbi:MAG: hypothetical protein GF320_12525 [Armatimonadia bacterium]|nr:hypothetical protein [Armatimonadia bacterium]
MRVVPGVAYALHADLMSGGVPSVTYLSLAWFDRSGAWIGNTRNGSVLSDAGGWHCVGVLDVAPPDAVAMVPCFRSDGNPGTAFCDAVGLEVSGEGPMAVPVAGGDFSPQARDLWRGEGVHAVWDDTLSRGDDGSGCVGFTSGNGMSTWTSSAFGTESMTGDGLHVELWVDSSRATSGDLSVLWEDEEGSVAVPLGSDGFVPVTLPWRAGLGTDFMRLVVRGVDLNGPVAIDDVSLVLDLREELDPTLQAVATACAYESAIAAPPWALDRFVSTFPDPDTASGLAALLLAPEATEVAPGERALELFRMECLYHAGRVEESLALATGLRANLPINDARRDLAMRYQVLTAEAAKEAKRTARIATLDEALASATSTDERLDLAHGYIEAEAPAKASSLLGRLMAEVDERDRPWVVYQASVQAAKASQPEIAVGYLKEFLGDYSWARWADDARVLLGQQYRDTGQYRRAIEVLEELQPSARRDAEIRGCYLSGRADADLRAEYTARFGDPLPELTYLGSDRDTRGEWIGAYGRHAFVLCGLASPRDIVGGRVTPVLGDPDDEERWHPQSVAWATSDEEWRYRVVTGDPYCYPRSYLHIGDTDDVRGLENPGWGTRGHSLWDDRGELHPYDGLGPDLCVDFSVPAGMWAVSAYFVDWDPGGPYPPEHPVTVSGGPHVEPVSFVAKNLAGGVYYSVAIRGPMDVRVRIDKGRSFCAGISGLFLDSLTVPEPLVGLLSEGIAPSLAGPAIPGGVSPWPILEAYPGVREPRIEAAHEWVATTSVQEADQVLDMLLSAGEIGAAQSLCAALQDVAASPDRVLRVASGLRDFDPLGTMELLEEHAQLLPMADSAADLATLAQEWHSWASSGDLETARRRAPRYLQALRLYELAAEAGGTPLTDEDLLRMGQCAVHRCLFDVGWSDAVPVVELLLDRYPGSPWVPEAIALLGKACLLAADAERSRPTSEYLGRLQARIEQVKAQHGASGGLADAMLDLSRGFRRRGEVQRATDWVERARSVYDGTTPQDGG